MKTVICQRGSGERLPDRQHHRGRQIRGHRLYFQPLAKRYFVQYGRDGVCGDAAYHGRQRPLATMRGLGRQNGIHIPVAQARLVQTHMRSQIFRIKHVFLGVVQLLPAAVITYLLLVLFTQSLTVEAVAGRERGDADRGGLNLLLLKKPRTRR